MSLLEKFIEIIKRNNFFSAKDKLLLAVSGGVDSVVLCELCKQAGFDFSIAHCNFQLRGEESERDEMFVRELGEKYGVETLVKKFDTESYAAENKLSVQEAARNLRYNWFSELIEDKNINIRNAFGKSAVSPDSGHLTSVFLLTAHHADDNIETLLMNFFRGTGLHGLTGIPSIAKQIRRPLLEFSKEQLLAFAKENNLGYVEDSSNASSKYTRNFFRNEIIPAIEKVFPQVKENLQDNIQRFKEIEKLYQLGITSFRKKLCRQKGNEWHIPIKQLMGLNNTALLYEIISPYGFSEKQVAELKKLASSESGKYLQSPANNFRIIKHRHWFIISPVEAMKSENIIIDEGMNSIEWTMGKLRLKKIQIPIPNSKSPIPNPQFQIPNSSTLAYLDLKNIRFPLLLRKWKQGDYFYPLGMKKKKKLGRFFIDQKLSKTEKEKIWVIESDKRIVWVMNHRIDDRFKLTENSNEILELSLTSAQ